DATCGACNPGYAFDTEMGRCVEVPANCDPGATASILDACTALSRTCTETSETTARCGECRDGYLEEGGVCVPIRTCVDEMCATMNRECTPATDTSHASCGACLPGYEAM